MAAAFDKLRWDVSEMSLCNGFGLAAARLFPGIDAKGRMVMVSIGSVTIWHFDRGWINAFLNSCSFFFS
jgi:hypothetical protein